MGSEQQATVIIQARMGSTRLPGKVLMEVMGRPLMDWLADRLLLARRVDRVILATTTLAKDDALADWAVQRGLPLYRGSQDDVLDRYRRAAEEFGADHVIRITGDCPLLDPALVDRLVDAYFKTGADYACTGPDFCEGVDCEVFSRRALETAWKNGKLASEREHVTRYFRNNPEKFSVHILKNASNDSHYRFTVDEPEDFEVVRALLEALHGTAESYFTVDAIKAHLDAHPDLAAVNSRIVRNQGLQRSLDAERGPSKEEGNGP